MNRSRRRAFAATAIALVAVGASGALLVRRLLLAREHAYRTSCLSNLKSLGLAFVMYRQDNAGYMPPADRPDDPFYWVPYMLGDDEGTRPMYYHMSALALICPTHETASMSQIRRDPARHLRYVVEPLLAGRHEREVTDPSLTLVAWEDAPYHSGGRIVSHFDGRAKWLPEDVFQEALTDSRRLLRDGGEP